ncbi:MAG: hypothetical protein NT062_30770 [Proteobacteria bacterium]|nr:hypothetical protein [Pseudomonadota bacterium]
MMTVIDDTLRRMRDASAEASAPPEAPTDASRRFTLRRCMDTRTSSTCGSARVPPPMCTSGRTLNHRSGSNRSVR